MKKINKLLTIVALLSATSCAQTPEQWSKQPPTDVVDYKADNRFLAICVKESLAFSSGFDFSVSTNPENGSIFVSAGDGINSGAITSNEFQRIDARRTRLKTRGMPTLASGPLLTQTTINAADKCAPRAEGGSE